MGKSGGQSSSVSTSTSVGDNPSTSTTGTSSVGSPSCSTITTSKDVPSSLFEESSKTNKTCQSSLLSSSPGVTASSNANASTGMNISCSATDVVGATSSSSTNFLFSSPMTDGSQNKLAKSNTKSPTSASGGSALYTVLGAKIPVISPSATAALEKHLKSLSVERNSAVEGGGTTGAVVASSHITTDHDNAIANNNNITTTKRNSRNMENVNFLSSVGLPPIPPNAAAPGSNNHQLHGSSSSNSTNIKESLISPSALPTRPSKVSLPTKSSKQGRLKSPSRRKSNVSSPPPSMDDIILGAGGGSCMHGVGASSSSGKSGKKKLLAKRYASSLPDRERCSATSPVAFDLNSYMCHNQGPIDFSSLLNRVHQQQQYLHQQQQQLSHHHSPHMIHHPQPTTVPFMGHPKPTKHCKNKHMWARASLERDIVTGDGVSSSPTPLSRGNSACNNLSGSNSGIHAFTDKPPCSSKVNGSSGGMPLPNPSNRHSSYHPNYNLGPGSTLVGDSAAAAAAAAAAAYNAHLLFSRPTSPLFLQDSASCCSDYSAYCPGCSTKTFPRVAARTGSNYGMCFCCHQNGNNINSPSQQSASRAQTATPASFVDGNIVGGGVMENRITKIGHLKAVLIYDPMTIFKN